MEAEVEVQITKATKSIDSLISSLKDLKKGLNDTLGSTENNKLDENTKKAKKNIDTIGALKKALNFSGIVIGLRKGADLVKNISSEYIDLIETNNLFEVSMGKVVDQYGNLDVEASKYYTKAMEFQDEMNEKLLTNEAELKNYQAMYYSMLKSQGIDKDASYLMSESLTKAGYDIASLYNLSVDDAMNKLKSGLAGQVESLRQIGIDVSESSLETVLNQLGIDRSVQELSYAEKEIARYIAIVQQGGQAQGDFARTMDSSANQIRIFQNQLAELKQVAGAFIMNTFGNILVYVNAIIMVIKEILKSFASLFGYDLESGGTDLAESTGIGDLNSGLDSAVGTAKELKKQLMGFDEINNITPQTNSGGGSGSGASMGIDDRLLEALDEWDNQMDSISGKAQEYRDKILEALGFTRDINGQLHWSFKDMNQIVKIITVIAGIIGGITLIGKITKIINGLKNLTKVFKGTKAPITTFGTGLQTIGKIINKGKSGYKNLIAWIKMVIDQYKIFRNQGNSMIKSLQLTNTELKNTGQGFLSLIPTSVKVIGGLAGLVASSVTAYNAMKDLSDGSISTTEGMLKLSASIAGATASGALIGSVFGPAGTVIGALTGLVISSTTAFIGYKDEIDKICEASKKNKEASEEYLNTIAKEKEAIEEQINTGLAQQEYYRSLVNELDGLVTANGKVKNGYEERVNFILNQLNEAYGTEYKQVDGIIQQYDDLKDNIYSLIDAKKAEIILNANEEEYANAISRQIQNQHEKINAQNKLNESIEAYNNKLKEIEDTYGSVEEAQEKTIYERDSFSTTIQDTLDEYYKLEQAVKDNQEALNNYSQAIQEDNETIILWEDLKTATIEGNADKINEKIAAITNTYNTETGKQSATLQEQISKEIDLANDRKRIWEENGIEINAEREKQLNNGIEMIANKLADQTQTVEDLTPDNINAWKTLSEGSKNIYNETLSTLPQETQILIQTITSTTEAFSPELIQQWADLAKNNKTAYENNLTGLDSTTSQRIQSCVDAINNKKLTAEETAKKLADAVEKGVNTIDTTEAGEQSVEGVAKGINDNKNNKSLWSAIGGLVTNVKNWFKNLFGIHSPSKVMADLAQYIPLGIAEGIKENTSTAVNQAKTMAEDVSNAVTNNIDTDTFGTLRNGIKVDTKDFAVNTNEYIDYSAIRGQVEARSNMTIDSNIIQGIAQAVRQALNETQVNVNIEAKADEGVIVKKASEGFTNYVMQTGELPFPIPV